VGGGRENLQADSLLSSESHVHPNIMTCAEIKSQTLNRLSHPGAS